MAMLTRFRKAGGFLQLVQLVETTEPRRRQGLLDLIAKEDPGWAQIVRLKLLTPERILGWKESALMEVWPHIPVPIMVTLWQKSDTAGREKIEKSMPVAFKNAFRTALSSIHAVDESEAVAAGLRLVSIVRDMSLHGLLNFREFDPGLTWEPHMVENMDPFKAAA